ncbi:helix-turn-helix domain-containing protein [Thalassotalea euphylliae]|uniref:Helix-turn-helix domain-containing protein n=1 Tax=Thalassotalea euphylliae TaxID=1655234 RepID=A0A3E0TPJ9_9GAMM|nr:helix-turn-helix domain-containing protein [Thalassotalea euphylliae]REL26240.1 helix-turn-helix domain-containing protein [Thalassotalea euphylliae]
MESQTNLALTETVNKLLAQSSVPAALTIEHCAKTLSMSMTSFRRKLAQEETSYKLIQQKFLNELCVQALLNKQPTIEELATSLGYSERATFERAFRQKFGITPSRFRKLSLNPKGRQDQCLIAIANELPPMPDSCAKLLAERDRGILDLNNTVTIVEKDPVFSGRIIGLASMAIYGKTPCDLREAIARNLGINTVVNLAVLFALKDALNMQVKPVIIERYCQVFALAPKLLQLTKKQSGSAWFKDAVLAEQVLVFSVLGIFLLAHKSTGNQALIIHAMSGINELCTLNHHFAQSLPLSLFGASSLLLSIWHLDAGIIKKLNQLDKIYLGKGLADFESKLLLLLLNCLYRIAVGHQSIDDLIESAELLGVENFADIYSEVTEQPT